MKVLFIGGTGVISYAATLRVANHPDWELTLLNRGTHSNLPPGVKQICCDVGDITTLKQQLSGTRFDVIANFIAYDGKDAARDISLFPHVRQYMFISTASAYQKPPVQHIITESTPLANPHWEYSRLKIDAENTLMDAYRKTGYPVTIVRPTHTYNKEKIPVAVGSPKSGWPVLSRMIKGKPVIIPGDGTSLWVHTHAEDFAKGFVGLMGNIHAIGHAFHITGDEVLTWNQIYGCVADALGVELKAVHIASDFIAATRPAYSGTLLGDKAHSTMFDNRKLKGVVPGFNATIRFDEGVRKAVQHYLEHPQLQVEDEDFDSWCDRIIACQKNALALFKKEP